MQLRRGGPWDEVARAEGQRLFDLAQLDLWDAISTILEPGLDRASLETKVTHVLLILNSPACTQR